MNYPLSAIAEAAQAFLQRYLQITDGEQAHAACLQLRPNREDYFLLFEPETAQFLFENYEAMFWADASVAIIEHRPEQTIISLGIGSTQALKQGSSDSVYYDYFPGGYGNVAPHYSAQDFPIMCFKLLAPGASLGMSHNGLYCMNPKNETGKYRFVWIPSPWRLLR